MAPTPDPHPPAGLTARNRQYLDELFVPGQGAGLFAPVFGYGASGQQVGHAEKIARTARILQLLAREGFDDFLDVGAAEGYTADWVRELFGVNVAACDLSAQACRNGRELLGVPTFACSADNLPLADRSFDCVLCSEVIEHLERPLHAIAELMRVTRRVLILTSHETLHFSLERWLKLKLRNPAEPHTELNWWLPSDFPALMGPGVEFHRQYRGENAVDENADRPAVRAWLRRALAGPNLERESVGGIVILRRPDAPAAPSGRPQGLDLDALWEPLLDSRVKGRLVSAEEDAWLLERLRAPHSRAPLTPTAEGLACQATGRQYPVPGGVPDLFGEPSEPGLAPVRLAPAAERRLNKLFDPRNVWPGGWRRVLAQTALGIVEATRDRRLGFPWAIVWRNLRHSTRFLRRSLSPRREGWLVRVQGTPEIFKIVKGRRRLILSPEILHRLGYFDDEVAEVSPAWLARVPLGEPLG